MHYTAIPNLVAALEALKADGHLVVSPTPWATVEARRVGTPARPKYEVSVHWTSGHVPPAKVPTFIAAIATAAAFGHELEQAIIDLGV